MAFFLRRGAFVGVALVSRRGFASSASSFKTVPLEKMQINKVLIANRGEIAVRVARTARRLDIRTAAVFSDADRKAMHVEMCDEAFHIGGSPAKESYLVGSRIIEVAKRCGAQAIHPGYGFLSENASFAEQCAKNNIRFIGPPVPAIVAMGSKSESKKIMEAANVPVVPGYHGDEQGYEHLLAEAEKIGFPVLIKAWMGGGGKGMRVVMKKEDFREALDSAKREAMSSFGDDRVLIEKFLTSPRHIEIQVFADSHGNCVYLFERDCSVQRRHQKVLEEAPAPFMKPELRRKMGESAVAAARAVGYVGAGTVEFIFQDDDYYFMEMNTRLQVEHPVTEMVTGEDLVEWQLMVAAGHELPKTQDQLELKGHAIEARVYAENPDNNFLPDTGVLACHDPPPLSDQVRCDTGVRHGDEISVFYDPMISKLIVWDKDRASALQRLHNALRQYEIVGLETNVDYLARILKHKVFQDGGVTTNYLKEYQEDLQPSKEPVPAQALAFAVLSGLVDEAKARQANAASSGDPTSPFANISKPRFNLDLTKTYKFDDSTRVLELQARFLGDHTYEFKLLPDGEPFIAKPSFDSNNDKLTVLFNDELTSATVVKSGDEVYVYTADARYAVRVPQPEYLTKLQSGGPSGSLLSPMPGKIIEVMVKEGDQVDADAPLLIMEAMKMEYTIRAPTNGTVKRINYKAGDMVDANKHLLVVEAAE